MQIDKWKKIKIKLFQSRNPDINFDIFPIYLPPIPDINLDIYLPLIPNVFFKIFPIYLLQIPDMVSRRKTNNKQKYILQVYLHFMNFLRRNENLRKQNEKNEQHLKKSHICKQHLILVMVLKSKITDALTLLFFLFKIIVNVKTIWNKFCTIQLNFIYDFIFMSK